MHTAVLKVRDVGNWPKILPLVYVNDVQISRHFWSATGFRFYPFITHGSRFIDWQARTIMGTRQPTSNYHNTSLVCCTVRY